MLSKDQLKNITVFSIVFGVSYLLFRAFKPAARKSLKLGDPEVKEAAPHEREFIIPPPLMDELAAGSNPKSSDAHLALCVYIDAINNGISEDELKKVNEELKNDYGVKVYRRRADNKIVVKDLLDKDVIEYDIPVANAIAA